MTGQLACRASQPGTEPLMRRQLRDGAPMTSASASCSAAMAASSRAGLPRRVRTCTSRPWGRRSVPARPAATSPGRRRARAGRSPGRSAVRSTCRWTTRARSGGGGRAGAPPRPRRPARCGCRRSRRNPPRPDDRAGHGRAVPAHAAVPAGPEGDKTLPGPMSASLREPVARSVAPGGALADDSRRSPWCRAPGGALDAGRPEEPLLLQRMPSKPASHSFIYLVLNKQIPSRASSGSAAGLNRTPEERSVMRAIKTALDPSGLFNPGVLFS